MLRPQVSNTDRVRQEKKGVCKQTSSQAEIFGIGKFRKRNMFFEIRCSFSTGVNPVHPKPAGRVVVSCMGDSVRIAEKYASIEWAGCMIEPRNGFLVMVKPTGYGQPACRTGRLEGSNDTDILRLSVSNHRGQRVGHAHRGKTSELGRSVLLLARSG